MAPTASPSPPLHLPGLVLAHWDLSCCRRRGCSYGKEGFHGAFLHAWPLVALPKELALMRPKCNQRRLQPESCPSPRAPHTASPHTCLCTPSSEQYSCPQKAALKTIFKQPNINGVFKPISS